MRRIYKNDEFINPSFSKLYVFAGLVQLSLFDNNYATRFFTNAPFRHKRASTPTLLTMLLAVSGTIQAGLVFQEYR